MMQSSALFGKRFSWIYSRWIAVQHKLGGVQYATSSGFMLWQCGTMEKFSFQCHHTLSPFPFQLVRLLWSHTQIHVGRESERVHHDLQALMLRTIHGGDNQQLMVDKQVHRWVEVYSNVSSIGCPGGSLFCTIDESFFTKLHPHVTLYHLM